MSFQKAGGTWVIEKRVLRTRNLTLRTQKGVDYIIEALREQESYYTPESVDPEHIQRAEIPASETDGGFTPRLHASLLDVLQKGGERDITAGAQAAANEVFGEGTVTIPAGIKLKMLQAIIVAGIEEMEADNQAKRIADAQLAAGSIDQATYDTTVSGLIENIG